MRIFGIGLLLSAVVLTAPAAMAQEGPGRGGPGRGGFGGGGFGGGTMLLAQKSVQAELKLSEEQVKQVDELLAKQRESFGDSGSLSREERQKRFAESREAGQKAVGSILNEEQQKRFKQVSLQLQGASALGDAEVATSLGLSDEQKKNVGEIQTAAREEMRKQFQDGGGDRDKFRAAREATNEKLQGVLTPEQKTKWQELTGAPFKGELQAPQRGGEGQRRRRNRDGAAVNPATTNVLTADKSDEKPEGGKKADKQDDGGDHAKKANGDVSKSGKARKHHGHKHAGKKSGKKSSHAKHASHRYGGRHGHHAQPGEGTPQGHAHRGDGGHHGQRRQGGPQGSHPEHARDARSHAWSRVAHAVSHGDGPQVASHRTGHRQHGQPEAHGSRRHGRSCGEHARHTHHGPRHHFASQSGGRHQRGPQQGFAHHGRGHRPGGEHHARHHGGPRPDNFQRFAGNHGPRHGRTHHRHHRHGQERQGLASHRGEARQHGPGERHRDAGERDGGHFHHVSESARHRGPSDAHGDHHKHHGHRAQFTGFKVNKDGGRAHGEHRHHSKHDGKGKKDGSKPKHGKHKHGERDKKSAERGEGDRADDKD